MHNNALTGLVEGSHQLLGDDHLGDESVDQVLLQLEHLSQQGLKYNIGKSVLVCNYLYLQC